MMFTQRFTKVNRISEAGSLSLHTPGKYTQTIVQTVMLLRQVDWLSSDQRDGELVLQTRQSVIVIV